MIKVYSYFFATMLIMLFDTLKFLKNQYFIHSFSNLVCYFLEYVLIHASNFEFSSKSMEDN